jgi:hypothetical protein
MEPNIQFPNSMRLTGLSPNTGWYDAKLGHVQLMAPTVPRSIKQPGSHRRQGRSWNEYARLGLLKRELEISIKIWYLQAVYRLNVTDNKSDMLCALLPGRPESNAT